MLSIFTALLLALPHAATTPPQEGGVEQAATDPLAPLREAYTVWRGSLQAGDETAIAAADARLVAAVQAFAAKPDGVELPALMQGIATLYQAQRYDDCLTVCDAGKTLFPEASELFGYTGLCELVLSQRAENSREMMRHAETALAALLEARELDAACPPAQIYLHYVNSTLGRFDTALEEYDAARTGPLANKVTTSPHYSRGRLLLGTGQYAAAVEELTADAAAKEPNAAQRTPMLVRALALSGQTEDAVARAKALWTERPDESSLALYTDVLAFTGQTAEALQLLEDAPIEAEDEDGVRKSRGTAAMLIALEGERPDDLRERLTTTQDHHFILAGMGPDGGDLELANSPICMGYLAGQVPWVESSWANDLLFYLCTLDAPTYEPSEIESNITGNMWQGDDLERTLLGPGASARARDYLGVHMVMFDSSCMLTISRLLEE